MGREICENPPLAKNFHPPGLGSGSDFTDAARPHCLAESSLFDLDHRSAHSFACGTTGIWRLLRQSSGLDVAPALSSTISARRGEGGRERMGWGSLANPDRMLLHTIIWMQIRGSLSTKLLDARETTGFVCRLFLCSDSSLPCNSPGGRCYTYDVLCTWGPSYSLDTRLSA